MKMKFLLAAFCCALGFSSFAQVSYGLKGGIGFPTWRYYDEGYNPNVKSVPSFNLSGYVSYDLQSNFSVQTGVTLEGRGVEIPEVSYKATYMFAGIPLDIVYYIPTSALGKAYVSAGPYAGVNFGGEYTAHNGEGGTFTEDMKYGKYEQVKRFDWGANFGLGYKFNKGYLIYANYNLGLHNMNTQSATEVANSRGLSFGVGFEF